MNIRIEQLATPLPKPSPSPSPNRRTRRRLPRNPADVRSLAAQAMLRSGDNSSASRPLSLARRGTSCLAVAVAALAVPALTGTAAAATPSAPTAPLASVAPVAYRATTPTAVPASPASAAPQARDHVSPAPMFPDSGTLSFESWAASGWSLNTPDALVDPRCLVIPHHHRCAPWLYHPDMAIGSSALLKPGDRSPVADASGLSHSNPRASDDPDAPEGSDTPSTPDPRNASSNRDSSTGPQASTTVAYGFSDLPRPAASNKHGDSTKPATAKARSRPLDTVTTLAAAPAPVSSTSALKTSATPASVPLTSRPASAASNLMRSPCLRAAYLVGKDRHMLAHLRPAVDAMGFIVNHRHAACTAMADYLSQARA